MTLDKLVSLATLVIDKQGNFLDGEDEFVNTMVSESWLLKFESSG